MYFFSCFFFSCVCFWGTGRFLYLNPQLLQIKTLLPNGEKMSKLFSIALCFSAFKVLSCVAVMVAY